MWPMGYAANLNTAVMLATTIMLSCVWLLVAMEPVEEQKPEPVRAGVRHWHDYDGASRGL